MAAPPRAPANPAAAPPLYSAAPGATRSGWAGAVPVGGRQSAHDAASPMCFESFDKLFRQPFWMALLRKWNEGFTR